MLKFRLEGERLKGRWMLVRTKPQTARQEHWLLVKERDALASPGFTTEAFMTSVASGRTMAEIASGQTARRRATSKPSAELDVATIAGARRSTMPASLRPQLAVTESAPPEGDQWVHEAKFDGYRLLAFKRGDDVRLISRTGKDWTARFKTVAETIRARVPVDAVLDGEAVVLDAQGVSNFQALQNAIVGRRNGSIVYFAFDLIWCDGFDLTRAGLLRRKEALLALIGPRQEGKLRYSEHAAVSGRAALAHARQNGLEGIVSKKITAAYSQTRTSSWVKSKCFSQQEFVVGGFTPPEGTREKFGALIIGYYDASSSWTTTGS
jgi:bifunctional non-homologous end joining protein LigD